MGNSAECKNESKWFSTVQSQTTASWFRQHETGDELCTDPPQQQL